MRLYNRRNCFILLFSCISIFLMSASSFNMDFVPYQGAMKEIVTDHFVIIYPAKFKKTAEKTARYAEDIHAKLLPIMHWNPYSKTNIVLTDHVDYPNGSGIVFFRNTITLYLTPAHLVRTLQDFQDPLYSLILHEYTHILHLDQIRGAAWFWRILYGKLYHPVVNTFRWYMEGAAVLNETLYAPGGRLTSSYTDAMVRRAAREHKIPPFDELVLPVVDWPHGDATYHYGAKFVAYIYEKYGKEKYDELFLDISDDFWPFVLLFVMKFEKIYGKKLVELWNEWIYYETKLAEASPLQDPESEKLTNLEGEIPSFVRGKDFFLISSSSYKNDNVLYKLYDSGKLKKVHVGGYYRSVSLTSDDNYFLYTRHTVYPGDFYFFDIFSINLKTGIEKKLTKKMRANYISFAQNSPNGVFVSHDGLGSRLYSAKFMNGKLTDITEIAIPENVNFIGQPSINKSGTKAFFSASMDTGKFRCFALDLESREVSIVDDNMPCKNVRWVDDNTLSFVGPDGVTDALFTYSLDGKETNKLVSSAGSILDGIATEDKVFYLDYTNEGEEIFAAKRNDIKAEVDKSAFEAENEELKIVQKSVEYKERYYTGIKNFVPTLWAFLPYQLNSSAYFRVGSGYLGIPFVGPQFMLMNPMPLGRFSYAITVGLDYLKLYPDNSVSLFFKFPFIDISYYWENRRSGYNYYLYPVGHLSQTYNSEFPIYFSNSLSLSYNFDLSNYGNFYWKVSASHSFYEYDFNLERLGNYFAFSETLRYYYAVNRKKASRWDRGVSITLYSLQYPHYVLDNNPIYLVKASISGHIPAGSAYFFIDIDGGIDCLFDNMFYTDSSILTLSQGVTGESIGGSGGANVIDTKSFSSQITGSVSGSAFVSSDFGFDITVYKKTKYSHFATLGFNEFYIKTYGEFVYLYNPNESYQIRGLLFDAVVELGLDLFIAYGNIGVSAVLGGSIGYRPLDLVPSWGVFVGLSAGL